CPGILVHWSVSGPSFLETFPVGQTSEGLGMLPFNIDTCGITPHAYSKDYEWITLTLGSSCVYCAELVPFIKNLVSIANDIKIHTNYRYCSHFDMVQVIQHYMEENNHLKLKVISHILTCLDNYKSLIMALSDHNVPCLQYILTVALKQGASIQ
ncbi:hypothetical protein EDD22DRAFT_767346, partial [Suillus occidentalis]